MMIETEKNPLITMGDEISNSIFTVICIMLDNILFYFCIVIIDVQLSYELYL